MSSKWDIRFLEVARMVASWSKDPSTKCGAVIVRDDHSIVSVGFNGFPRAIHDEPELLANREEKLKRVIHAEMNAILSAGEVLHGYTMYTYPPGLSPSCERCAAHIIQAGITRIVHIYDEGTMFSQRWAESAAVANALFQEAGVEVVRYLPEVLSAERE